MMLMPLRLPVFLLLTITALSSCLKSKEDTPPPPVDPPGGGGQATYDWPKIADSAFSGLNNYFWHAGEGFFRQDNQSNNNFNYWWNAHGVDALVDVYLRNQSGAVAAQLNSLVQGMKNKNNGTYLNEYYDDMEWMALACLRAYGATNNNSYKEIAELLWNDIKTGWNEEAGGGIAWRKSQRDYKNTPANAPAAILAARLYALNGNNDDLDWAKRIYSWLVSTLLDNSTGYVWDGINRQGDGRIDTDWKFTYNQGVFIGAALELFVATGDDAYKSAALRTANFSITDPQLAPSGILKNENQGDGGLFKGILVRYLEDFAIRGELSSNDKTKLVNFLEANAKSLWSKATAKQQSLFNSDWTSMPGNQVESSTQLSGVFLMETMARLKAEGLIQ